MKREELIRKLEEASNRLQNSKEKFEIYENVELGRGAGNYTFVFVAKKKKKRGIFGAIANIAKKAYYYGTSGVAYGILDEIARRKMQNTINLGTIEREITGAELAMILRRWVETIPKGYIETIGNNLQLPQDDKWISASIRPDKEIRIRMEFVKLYTGTEPVSGEESVEPQQPQPMSQAPQIPPQKPMPIPIPIGPIQIPTVDFSNLYVKGSLAETEDGASFAIRNPIKPTRIVAPLRIRIDGKQVNDEDIVIVGSAGERANLSISRNNPFPVAYGETLLIKINNIRLTKGIHKIDIAVMVEDMGEILISNADKT